MTPARDGTAMTTPARARNAASAARSVAIASARAADGKLAEGIVVLNVTGLTPVADFIVIATADSRPHMNAVAESAEDAVKIAGGHLHHREGGPESPWILLDCGDVIFHVFDGATRRFYDLERLWDDASLVEWHEKPSPKVGKANLRPAGPAKQAMLAPGVAKSIAPASLAPDHGPRQTTEPASSMGRPKRLSASRLKRDPRRRPRKSKNQAV